MTKKLLSILLTIVIVLSIAPVAVFAENDILDYLSYEIVDGEVTITDCDEAISGEVVIPDTIEGYPVTVIGEHAFEHCSYIKQITIPSSVREINYCAFSFDTLLSKFEVSEENQFFSNDEHGVLFNKEKTVLIQYPIGSKAKTYDIPAGVTEIYSLSFASADNLENITIPETVLSVGAEAFFTCMNLKSIIIPASVTELNYSVFQNCVSLEKAEIYSTEISTAMFTCCVSLNKVYISENVKKIEEMAFYKCYSLEKIHIPESVEYIDYHAFYDCKSLSDIYVENQNAKIAEVSDFDDFSNEAILGFADIELKCSISEFIELIHDCCDLYREYLENFEETEADPEFFEQQFIEKLSASLIDIENSIVYLEQPEIIENLVFYGYTDSTIESYANEHGFKFVPICDHINTETINIAESDCENDGYTGDIFCNDCEEIIENGEIIPSSGHNYIENIIKVPTYSQDGLKNTVCENCGDATAEEVIPQITIEGSKETENTDTDISIIYPDGAFDGEIEVKVTPVAENDAFKLISHKQGKYKVTMFDINVTVDGEKVQPNGTVLVKIPLPKGYNQNKCVVYYVADDGTMEELTTYHFKDGYVYFETDHFSYYAITEDIEESSDSESEISFIDRLITFFKMIIDFFKQIFGIA